LQLNITNRTCAQSRGEFSAKQKFMAPKIRSTNTNTTQSDIVQPPAYPFSGRALFHDLRVRLSQELREPLGFDRLAQIIGQPKSTTHHWFAVSDDPHVIALMCLLERLSPAQRQLFIESHVRAFPSLEHASLAHAPAKIGKLFELLRQERGLTIITGATDSTRTYLVTALGHAYRSVGTGSQNALGIDFHRPINFVPVESLNYVDYSLNPRRTNRAVLKLWPRIQTASGRLVILNGVWTALPEIRDEILRCANHNHVILADGGVPNLNWVRSKIETPINVVTVSTSKRVSGGILINCRKVNPRKPSRKTGSA
jgi:hypothetical protein